MNYLLINCGGISFQTKKPFAYAFGILKHRCLVLREGLRMQNEDDIRCFVLRACYCTICQLEMESSMTLSFLKIGVMK